MYSPGFLFILVSLCSLVNAASFHREQCDIDVHGVCFVVSLDVASWEDAQSRCQELGGNLAVLEKSPLRNAVDILFATDVPMWLGLRELEVENHPYWVNGNKLGKHGRLKHYPWNKGDQNSDDNDCVLAAPDVGNARLLWQYANCETANRYLCGISNLDENAKEQLKGENNKKEEIRQAELNSTFAIIEEENKNIDQTILIEGDIMLTPEQRATMNHESTRKRGVHLISFYLWPNGIVYYEFDSSVFSDTEKAMILDAMDAIRDATCIDFVERHYEYNYVFITKKSGCYSYIGKVGGRQELSLATGCLRRIGVSIHEFLHALGFFHEQSRPDRDNYVEINYDNVKYGYRHNFLIQRMNTQNTSYDYGSVMHYGRYTFAQNRSIPTIILKQHSRVTVGQRNGLSSSDVYELNRIYNCQVPVDGNWCSWSPWSPCPVTCGRSTQTRTRQCNSPPPTDDPVGQPCFGDGIDTRACMDIMCPEKLDYTWLGCYLDEGDGELLASLEDTNNPYLIGPYRRRSNPVQQCAEAAAHIHHDIFALRFGGKCYSMNSEEDGVLFQEGGASDECYDGTGRSDSIDAYFVETSTRTWGEWSQWSNCSYESSTNCLGGVRRGQRTRARDCKSVQICEGASVEEEDCQETCQSEDTWLCVGPDLFVFVVRMSKSWEDSRTQCPLLVSNYQANLAVLGDELTRAQAQNFIPTTIGLQSPPGGGYWIGCSDIEEEGSFVWVNGAPVDVAISANNISRCRTTGKDCCQFRKKGRAENSPYHIGDACCHRQKAFICQIHGYCDDI